MKTKSFRHLSSFGYSGAIVPVKKIETLFSTRLQAEVLDEVLRESNPEGPSIHELPEPDLAKLNYIEKIRGGIQSIWQPLVEDSSEIPSPQLLERLNRAWNMAEKKIGEEVQSDAREILRQRALGKTEIIKSRASREAAEKGIPGTLSWLQGLKDECVHTSRLIGEDVVRFGKRKAKQKENIEEQKEGWNIFLLKAMEVTAEPQHVARNLLVVAGLVLLIGLGLWTLTIPVNSVFGAAGMVIAVLVALKLSWPLFRQLGISRNRKLFSARLASAYKSMSLFGLDELTKRLELEYFSEELPATIDNIIAAYQERYVTLEKKRASLNASMKVLQSSLHAAPATVRTVLRDSALGEWYDQGKVQAPKDTWKSGLCSIDSELSWVELSAQSRDSFEFLRSVKVEDEIFRLYTNKEERLCFLASLREAAIGKTPGEALLSIDFAPTGARPLENYIIVEIADIENSELAREVQTAWGDAGLGLSIVPSSDASTISFIGIVYGFPFETIRDYAASLKDFEEALKIEGDSIYPVLLPAGGTE